MVDDDLLVQDHRSDSHFQNAATFQTFSNELLRRVTAEKMRRMAPHVTPVLIIDQAGQHKMDTLTAAGFKIVFVPKKLTHIFQPADQFIIAGIKELSVNALSGWRSDLFEDNNIQEAVKVLVDTNAPTVRKQKITAMLKAVRTLSPAAVEKSWEMCGINRALFKDVPRLGVNSDEFDKPVLEGHMSMIVTERLWNAAIEQLETSRDNLHILAQQIQNQFNK
eukprot:PhM_4_TR10507/c2_g1_i4/m.106140